MNIKEDLINTNIVVDNIYLDKYVKLITDNLKRKPEKFKTQKHHIIPRCFYKYNKITINNNPDNIVNLLYKDHILAHYYLYLIANGPKYKYAFSTAFLYLFSARKSNIPNTNRCKLDEDDIKFEVDNLQSIYEENSRLKSQQQKGKNKGIKKGPMSVETRNKISLAHKGKESSNKGKKFPNSYTNERKLKQKQNASNRVAINKDDVELHIKKLDLDRYLSEGWVLGKSPSNKSKILKTNSDKSRNNKISDKLKGHKVSEVTKEKIRTKLQGKSYGHSNMAYCWVNNDKNECMILKDNLKIFLKENIGYKKGRLNKKQREENKL